MHADFFKIGKAFEDPLSELIILDNIFVNSNMRKV